jgi:phosphoribosyl-ATP pyrophosphohydrolase/phosphoribosyl-AMP cyclohydrolase
MQKKTPEKFSIARLDFAKGGGLLPVIVQDDATLRVLMLGYMNREALEKTLREERVTFFSRTKNRLWTKGESSGNYLNLVSIKADCDHDTLLAQVRPQGPACHTGQDTCFAEDNRAAGFLPRLEAIIQERKNQPLADSYTSSLFQQGLNKIAQKVGEEAVELIIEAKDDDERRFLDESADLVFHFLVLLVAKGFGLEDVLRVLERRHGR